MKNTSRNIAATVLSLAIASPFAIQADETNGVDFGFDAHTEYFNEAEQLLTLDDEALNELSEAGIDLETHQDKLAQHIIDYATQYLGRPYRSGAKGPKAFDCSGFTSYIFKEYGIELNPSSRTQATQGTEIELDQVQPGDLLFFGGRAGVKTVGHVAIAVEVDDNGTIKFIHAANRGGIRYDNYPDGGYYSKRYLGARRVIE